MDLGAHSVLSECHSSTTYIQIPILYFFLAFAFPIESSSKKKLMIGHFTFHSNLAVKNADIS